MTQHKHLKMAELRRSTYEILEEGMVGSFADTRGNRSQLGRLLIDRILRDAP